MKEKEGGREREEGREEEKNGYSKFITADYMCITDALQLEYRVSYFTQDGLV